MQPEAEARRNETGLGEAGKVRKKTNKQAVGKSKDRDKQSEQSFGLAIDKRAGAEYQSTAMRKQQSNGEQATARECSIRKVAFQF